MVTSDEIEAGAKLIAEEFRLPGGSMKMLTRVVEDHLDWFDKAEARGFTWSGISRLLFAAGAKGRNGRPFSVGTLYSTVWRKREAAKRVGGGTASSAKSSTGIQGVIQKSPTRQGRSDGTLAQNGKAEPPRKPRPARRSSTLDKSGGRSDSGEKEQVKASKERPKQPVKNKELLAFMRRSAAVRGYK